MAVRYPALFSKMTLRSFGNLLLTSINWNYLGWFRCLFCHLSVSQAVSRTFYRFNQILINDLGTLFPQAHLTVYHSSLYAQLLFVSTFLPSLTKSFQSKTVLMRFWFSILVLPKPAKSLGGKAGLEAK